MTEINWEQFVEEYYQRIYRYCYQFLGRASEAEDVTQETFLKAYRSRSTLKDSSARSAWIYSIARNSCLDKKRWWQRYFRVLEDVDTSSPETPGYELTLTLRKLILDLPHKQREVFILRHWHQFSTKEAADLLGIQEGTVKSHLKRAVEKLKAALLKDENFLAETTEPMGETSYTLNKEEHYEIDHKR